MGYGRWKMGMGCGAPTAESAFDRSPCSVCLDVAVNGHYTVVRPGQFFVKALQIGGLDSLHAGLGAERVQSVAGVAEKGPAHGPRGALEQFVLLRADSGQLDLAFAFQSRGRKGWVQENVRQQVQPDGEIAAQDFGVDAEAVVPAEAVHAATDRLNFFGNVLAGALAGAFEQQLAGELGQTVVVLGFSQHTTREHSAKLNKRKPMKGT